MSLTTVPTDFEQLFESVPISLWLEDYSALKALFDFVRSQGVEDFSEVKLLLDEARAQGIQDFRVFLSVHSEFVNPASRRSA
jgi:hypothetical protein